MPKPEIKVVEVLTLCGYAYFRASAKARWGRVFWSCDPSGADKHSLSISPSWGLPDDATLAAIKMALISHVQSGREAPELSQ